jgi:hypothetical protein
MVGQVHEQTPDARGKLLLSHTARLFQIGHREGANPISSAV